MNALFFENGFIFKTLCKKSDIILHFYKTV